jgi:hypothetical protein
VQVCCHEEGREGQAAEEPAAAIVVDFHQGYSGLQMCKVWQAGKHAWVKEVRKGEKHAGRRSRH